MASRLTDSFIGLPHEIVAMILGRISMTDRINFSATCRAHRTIVGRALLTDAARRLKPYHLSLSDWRLLQSCKRTFISGHMIKDILYGERFDYDLMGPVPPTRHSGTLDIYCARHDGLSVSHFIRRATGYSFTLHGGGIDVLDGIHRTYTLLKGGSPDIRIFETTSENPLDVVFRFPTTADMGVWLLDRIWHAYPSLSFQGIAITTPTRLPLDSVGARQRTWDVVQSNFQLGFRMQTALPKTHICTTVPSCPASYRSSQDGSCLSLCFHTLPWSSVFDDDIWEGFHDVGWSLGAVSFCDSWHIGKGKESKSYMEHEREHSRYPSTVATKYITDHQWKQNLYALLQKTERPTE
ncbi:hypothetical protein C8R43DRAFT_949266 [Mycena crocata]|nr:hypothetical protein C8R43DRAFT_949266 [Mycena crocata]